MFRYAILPVVALAVVAVVLASVFAYYPLTITATPQAPGVVFQTGSNAGQPDIGNNQISVTIGKNATSASVEIHPTYRETYYKDVLRIKNNDNDAMRVYLIFDNVQNTLPSGSKVWLFVYGESGKVAELNITSPQLKDPISIGEIASGATWQIDLYVYIPEGSRITATTTYTASARLVYSPSTETPPVNPASGR